MRVGTLRRRVPEPRLFTPIEANALLPRVRPILAALREVYHEYRFVREQWEELEALGEKGPELAEWRGKADALGARVVALLQELKDIGVEVKDPILGLIDFLARHPDGSIVCLCYRDDEHRVDHWHPLETGFAGRQPVGAW